MLHTYLNIYGYLWISVFILTHLFTVLHNIMETEYFLLTLILLTWSIG